MRGSHRAVAPCAEIRHPSTIGLQTMRQRLAKTTLRPDWPSLDSFDSVARMATLSRARRGAPIFRHLFLLTAGSAVVTWAGRGEAQMVAGVDVRWVAPAGCPDADDVRTRVRRLLGTEMLEASPKDHLIAESTVVAIQGRYRLSLTVRPEKQPVGVTRVFDSDSCESLAGAAAVTLGLLARGERPTDGASAPPSFGPSPPSPQPANVRPQPLFTPPSPGSSPPAAAPPPTPPAPNPTQTSKPRWAPTLQVPLLAVDEGNLPSLASGLGVAAGIRVSRVQVTLGGVLWLPQSSTGASFYGATYTRRSGELASCYAWQKGPFEAGPCLAVTLEDVTARGTGPGVGGGPGHTTWLAAGMAVGAKWSLSGWAALFLRPSLTFATSRPTFAVDGVGPIYHVPLASVGVQVGSEWTL